MNKVKELISKVEVRKTIALSLTALFIYMSFSKQIEPTQVVTIYGVIIGFYFGKSTALETPKTYDNNSNKGQG